MIAGSQAEKLLATMQKLSSRTHAALERLQKAKKQIEDCGYTLNKEAAEILEMVAKLDEEISGKANLIKAFSSAPVLEQVYGMPTDEYETYVGYAEDWAETFEQQAAEAQSAPNGPLN